MKRNNISTKKINSLRGGCKDVFNAFLVNFAIYDGYYEFPKLNPTYVIPRKLISFSKCITSKRFDYWIHFYEDDFLFERLWRNPRKYLNILKKFEGVILPDFSLYRDMPLAMQLWNIYRSRAIGYWLQNNGVNIIPNIRFGDERTYDCCCEGISKSCVISIGSYGTMKNKIDKRTFITGLDYIIRKLRPSVIIIYGSLPDNIIKKYKQVGINIILFEPEYYFQLSFNIFEKECK